MNNRTKINVTEAVRYKAMTVSYNAEVQTSNFARFWRLLFRWRGSLLKLIWRDSLLFSLLYLTISIVYHLAHCGVEQTRKER